MILRRYLLGAARPAARCATLIWGGIFLLLVGLGAYFRFADPQRQYYWHDEAYTLIKASGYRAVEVSRRLFRSQTVTVGDIQQYQRPAADRSLLDTVAVQAREEPQHPPLYYLMASIWMRLFANSAMPVRSLSAIFGFLTVPGIYWLCLELFRSRSVALAGSALMLVSPFNVLYSREVREYSLLMLLIVLATAALVRACRLNTRGTWICYSLISALGLYTQPIFVLALVAHAAYAIAREGFRPSRLLGRYLLSSLAAGILFIPWIVAIMKNFALFTRLNLSGSGGAEPARQMSLLRLRDTIFLDFASPFVDFASGDFQHRSTTAALSAAAAVWVLAAYCVWRVSPKAARLLVVGLIMAPLAAFLVPDVLAGGRRVSLSPQYYIPAYVGLYLAVAYVLGTGVRSQDWRRRAGWLAVGAGLALGGIVSCRASFEAERWWNKPSIDTPTAARIVNQAADPLILASGPWPTNLGDVLSLSHRLDPAVRVYLLGESDEPNVTDFSRETGEVFVFGVSYDLLQALQESQRYRVEAVVPNTLWRVMRERP